MNEQVQQEFRNRHEKILNQQKAEEDRKKAAKAAAKAAAKQAAQHTKDARAKAKAIEPPRSQLTKLAGPAIVAAK